MFGIGMPEMLLILAIALIVIGPKKLPDLARSLGKAMGEFKKATSELKDSIQLDAELKDVNSAFKDINTPSGKASQPAPVESTEESATDGDSAADGADEVASQAAEKEKTINAPHGQAGTEAEDDVTAAHPADEDARKA